VLVAVLAGAARATAAPAPAAIPSGAQLEAAHAVIGKITIVAKDVFDTDVKGERAWLYRTTNKLHITTRPSVIRRQLLFKSGQPYRQRLIDESERILRTNSYLYEASIVAVAWDGRAVDLEVRTRDTWTLNPGINFSRAGGTNKTSVQLEERNFLGTGQRLVLDWSQSVYRSSLTFAFNDPHFFSTWTSLGVLYANSSDGHTALFNVEQPFYALDARDAGGLYAFDEVRTDYRYDLGHEVGQFQQRQQTYQAYGGWSRGLRNGWAARWTAGGTLERADFSVIPGAALGGPLPANQLFAYPWVGFEIVEDSYEERVNLEQIERTEDVLMGIQANARIGYAPQSLGSYHDAWLLRAYAQDGLNLRADETLLGSVSASGRLEGGTLRNGILTAETRYFLRTSKNTRFFASLRGTVTENLDQQNQLLLGGDNGLRGYPFNYQAGTALALLTLEERYYSHWYPFRLFHVGAATFFDMGRTWGTDVTGATSAGLLKDVGIGLRLGSSRSAFGNVLHIDVAFPLQGGSSIERWQVLVQTQAKF